MRAKTIIAHVLFVTAGLALILLVPFLFTDTFKSLAAGGGVDAVTSASVIIDQPAGEYLVFVNKELHPDKEKLAEWIRFFNGEEISYIFEDISCSVAQSDPGAVELGESFRSRLPENQMLLKTEDPILLVSREENDKFDILIMSAEFADAYGVIRQTDDSVEVIRVATETGSGEETETDPGADTDGANEESAKEQGV